jgi:hybrid cluster-associated redox disulfide protein
LHREADVNSNPIVPEDRLSDLFSRWPAAISIFNHHRMSCAGCWMASFDTLQDAIFNYGLNAAQFIAELEAATDTHLSY